MLTYDILLSDALEKIPEFKNEYERLKSKEILGDESGNHVIFGYAFTPILINAIKGNDAKLRGEMLAYVESMSNSDDHLVVEVCDYSILEALNDEFDDDFIKPLLGPSASEGYDAIKQYMN